MATKKPRELKEQIESDLKRDEPAFIGVQHIDPPCPGKTVYRAINRIQAALSKEGISKDRKNVAQGYAFRGIDDVYNVLAPLLAEHKLLILPRMKSRTVTERESKQGGALFNVAVEVEYDFISVEDGSTHMVGPIYGEAMDSADKATNKAMSAAYKYMAVPSFCIPVKGEEDADATTPEPTAKKTYPLKPELKPQAAKPDGAQPEDPQKYRTELKRRIRAYIENNPELSLDNEPEILKELTAYAAYENKLGIMVPASDGATDYAKINEARAQVAIGKLKKHAGEVK